MSDYYAKRGGELAGPFPTYTHAIADNARQLHLRPGPVPSDMRVLLDVGSVNSTDDTELRELLHHDPLLAAVFALGHHLGRKATW